MITFIFWLGKKKEGLLVLKKNVSFKRQDKLSPLCLAGTPKLLNCYMIISLLTLDLSKNHLVIIFIFYLSPKIKLSTVS